MYNRFNVTILKILQQVSALHLTKNKTLKNSIEWGVDVVGNILISSGRFTTMRVTPSPHTYKTETMLG